MKVELIRLNGESMLPSLHHHDLLEVAPIKFSSIKMGDVIAFQSPGKKIIIHRVVAINKTFLLTRGDNLQSIDPWRVAAKNIRGRVVGFWRQNKHFAIRRGWQGRMEPVLGRLWMYRSQGKIKILREIIKPYILIRPLIIRALPTRYRPQVILFRDGDTINAYLMVDKRRVGAYKAQIGKWQISLLFRFIVDARTLPTINLPINNIPNNIYPDDELNISNAI